MHSSILDIVSDVLDTQEEKWKSLSEIDAEQHSDLYKTFKDEHNILVSNMGKVYDVLNKEEYNYSYTTEKWDSTHQYKKVSLKLYDGSRRTFDVHRLVALLFVDRQSERHKYARYINNTNDADNDCKYYNLEWKTHCRNFNVKSRVDKNIYNKKIQVYDVESRKYIDTYHDIDILAEELNVHKNLVVKCLMNNRCKTKKYRFVAID